MDAIATHRIAHDHLTDFTAFAEVVARLLPPE